MADMLLVPLALIALCGLAQTLPLDEVVSSSLTLKSELPDGGDRVVVDQRQSGKYNIHVSIKDVAIIEVGQNELTDGAYNDAEDYYYDDSALTIKPIKFSTEAIGSSSSTATATAAAAATTSTTAMSSSTTTETPSTALKESLTTASEAPLSSLNTSSTYSSNLLADIAASRMPRPKHKPNNLMIMETTIGGSPTAVPHLSHPRSKDIPIMAAAAAVTRPSLPQGVEYTPPQGHNSPIFKVKVQRSAVPQAKKPTARCRSHQSRNAQGKCADSIYRRLYSMLMGLNIPGLLGTLPHTAEAS